MIRILRSEFIPFDYCLVHQYTRLVFYYASELKQFYGCKYYYEPEEDIVTRFVKGLSLYIKDNMPTYTIYTLQHAIHVAMQIESQIRRERSKVLK